MLLSNKAWLPEKPSAGHSSAYGSFCLQPFGL